MPELTERDKLIILSSQIVDTPDGFQILNDKKEVALQYKWVE